MSQLEDPSRPEDDRREGERREAERRQGERRQQDASAAEVAEPPDELPEEDTAGVEPSS